MEFLEKIRENPALILWIYLGVINLLSFLTMGLDKLKAKRGSRRVPESTLFLMAIIGGSVGGIGGIYAFRHKTLHKQFTIGFPLILILQIVLVLFIVLK